MASTFSPLGIELQATGENAGTWGTKTNTNLSIIEQISGGFTTQAVTDSGTPTALSVSDGSTGATLAHRVIEFTGSLSAGREVTIPLDVQNFYILKNATSGGQTVTFKYVSGSGDTAVVPNGKTVIAYAKADDGTNPNIVMVEFGGDVVDDTSPQLGGDLDTNSFNIAFDDAHGINDENGNQQIIFQTTGSAVNQIDVTNAATGNAPSISATGDDTNVSLNLVAKGTGSVQSNGSAVKVAGKESIWVPAVAMYPNTTNGAGALTQTELGNGPEIKALPFDKTSDEFAQFAIAFPKSWNEGTVTFQAFFTADSTDTGTAKFTLAGVALADNDSLNTAFGTAVGPSAKAHSGTANDLDVTAESGAVTIAGSPSVDEYVFFEVSRDVSEDDLDADAKLLGIKLFFTTDAANDA
tara:strand:- start:5761 stop:6990 length:1230 start_codon:yes stop_codon:yes gene_type:complete